MLVLMPRQCFSRQNRSLEECARLFPKQKLIRTATKPRSFPEKASAQKRSSRNKKTPSDTCRKSHLKSEANIFMLLSGP